MKSPVVSLALNNTTVGPYAKIVRSPEYRDRKVGTALELLPAMLGPHAEPFDLVHRPDGTEHQSAHLIPVEIGVDGEAMLLDPPIRFRTAPGALRVRIPPHAPGYSPVAAMPTPGWSTITALLQTAAGRLVTIEP